MKINKILLPVDADTAMFSDAQRMVQDLKDVQPSYKQIVLKKFVDNSQHGGNSWTEEVTQVFESHHEGIDRVLQCRVLETKVDGDVVENVLELTWLFK